MRASSNKTLLVLACATLLIGVAAFLLRSRRDPFDQSTTISDTAAQKFAAHYRALEAREKRVDETAWAKERLAEDCGRTFEKLWDALNAATNKLDLIAAFPVGEIVLGDWSAPHALTHGIESREPAAGYQAGPRGTGRRTDGASSERRLLSRPAGTLSSAASGGEGRGEEVPFSDPGRGPATPKTLSAQDWRVFVEQFIRAGWRLEQIEFRQNQFDTDAAGRPRQSRFFFSAHLLHPGRQSAVASLSSTRPAKTGPPEGGTPNGSRSGTSDANNNLRSERSLHEPGDEEHLLSPSLSSAGSGGEGARRAGVEAPRFTVPMHAQTRTAPFHQSTLTRPPPTLSHPMGEGRGERVVFLAAEPVRTEPHTLPERAILEGDLVVGWTGTRSGDGLQAVKWIDASHLTIKTRRGEPPFQPILEEQITPSDKSQFIDPVILYDLDGDGLSEIILPARNLVYRRRGEDRFAPQPLCRYPPGSITTAVIADFDGDGFADLLCAKAEGLVLFKGSPQGTFDQPGRLVWSANPRLNNAMVLTCGDIDRDGDLDVFLAQYEVPSLGQILRPHYYEANDGFPAYLLLNDGHGNFTDATATAGLDRNRLRRTYSASFADLNDDGNLDLVVVSDFAGLDLYRNDGRGHFTDVTHDWVAEPHGFGMAHALADFNADGRLDLLMIGMPSPTVDRLEHLGLWRPDATEDRTMRPRMTFGNRLFLARPNGGFEQTSLNDSIARSGWSWGCSAFDFDNDGFPDVYIANGMQSKQSVREYEGEFWLHDIYIDESVDDATATTYFTTKFAGTRGRGWSYGGYEKNRLYLNQHGASFLEAGYLMGVALEEDSRNVVTDDLDGDGRVDLLVTTLEVWPAEKQTLRVYKNTLPDTGNWIGFRFREEPGASPIGVRVTVHWDGHSAVREIVTGDSHRSQHANTVHFGLGAAERVDRVEVRWPNRQTVTLREPPVNRYHLVRTSSR